MRARVTDPTNRPGNARLRKVLARSRPRDGVHMARGRKTRIKSLRRSELLSEDALRRSSRASLLESKLAAGVRLSTRRGARAMAHTRSNISSAVRRARKPALRRASATSSSRQLPVAHVEQWQGASAR